MSIESRNPATGQLIERFEPTEPAEVEAALDAAVEAFRRHGRAGLVARATKADALADALETHKPALARLLTEEMGKTLGAAMAEIDKCAWVCRYYAEHGGRFLADTPLETEASTSFVRHLPLGPVLAVMPWNFPFWQVFRAAVPAIMAGNVILLKHASNVPRAALAIERLFTEAGFAPGTLQTLLLGSDAVAPIIEDSRVQAVTVTGSARAGAAVAAAAGRCYKKSVLELGGSDAFIVMPSADLDAAAATGTLARNVNNGQSCIAAKRFIVHADVYDEFLDRFASRFSALRVGDPRAETTDVGPLASAKIRERLTQQVAHTIELGAERVLGAEPVDGTGYFFQPGIVSGIPREAPLYTEEVFGPVAAVFSVADTDEAIVLANDTRYGLGASVWTHDAAERDRFIAELDTGATFVNAMVQSDPRAPFGGVKASGYGRELARDGILEFVNRKTVHIG